MGTTFLLEVMKIDGGGCTFLSVGGGRGGIHSPHLSLMAQSP